MPGSRSESRRLDAARLIGSAAVASLGQFAVDAPDGYFGPSDRVTAVGAGFLAGILLLAGSGAALRLAGRASWRVPALGQVVAVLAAFVPPLATDPIVCGAVLVWHLVLFGRLAVGPDPFPYRARRLDPAEDDGDVWLRRNAAAARHVLGVSLLVAVAVLGYRLGAEVPARAICLVLGAAALIGTAPFVVASLRRRRVGAFATVGLVAASAVLAATGRGTAALGLLAAAQLAVLVGLVFETRLFADVLDRFYARPAWLVLSTFVVLIAVGTLLLSFPVSAATPEAPVRPVDALFTATSAACVTGLIVLDTPNDFSPFGLAVILVLMQAGGLNMMVLSSFAAVLLGRGLGLRGEGALGNVLDLQPGRSAQRLAVFIVVATLAIEAVGALILGALYAQHGYEPARAAAFGIFHAVSAFCNAGFSLHSDSLVGFAGDPWMLGTFAALIVVGGLGFAVLHAGWAGLRRRGRTPVALQSRIVLAASGVLLVAGTLVYAGTEWNGALDGLSGLDKWTNAAFQSVTLRTAGFNSVSLEGSRPETVVAMLAFMFVGASPGSTGGGIKTTTAVVLIGAVVAILARRDRVVLFRHRIPLRTVDRAAAIAVLAVLAVGAGAFLLLATQDGPFESLLFEAMSAFGTVGLSLGATAELDAFGKVLVAALMLAGRVGPLTLALLLGRESASRVRYPDARIMVG